MIEEIVKILVAFIIGAVIGTERELKQKPVGMRTLALVCISSCLAIIGALWYSPQDAGRVISGIITGIGFLGAGAIISEGKNVKGLTTATTIWAVAIIGIIIGLGYYLLAIIAALLMYIVLRIRYPYNKPLKKTN